MKKIIIIISLVLCYISCSSNQGETTYTKGLEGAFNQNELTLLNELARNFEAQLKKHYNSDDIDNLYKRYLIDFSSASISPSIYTNPESKNLIKKTKDLSLFSKIWILDTDLPKNQIDSYEKGIELEEPIFLDSDGGYDSELYEIDPFYCLNPDGAYFKTIIEKEKDPDFSYLLSSIKSAPNIYPSVVSGVIPEPRYFASKNLKRPEVKLFIALFSYYTAVLDHDL